MPSSSRRCALGFVLACSAAIASSTTAEAQQQPDGFALDRLYTSAPGGGWFVMDDLRMHGGLGAAAAMTIGYARDSLRVTDGVTRLAVVSDQLIADFGLAVTYDRWRAYLSTDMPLATGGQSGTVGDYSFTAPLDNPSSTPDTFSDVRIGLDGRLLGEEKSRFRLGAGLQLFVPNGKRAEMLNDVRAVHYDTDGTYRAMGRLLVAGDLSHFTYAAHVGVHVRPLDDSPAPGTPQGSELLFGLAAGPRLAVGTGAALVVGPEVFGETALRSPFGSTSTGLEALLSGRIEATGAGPKLRVKLGAGGGIDAHFGAPAWRLAFAIEVSDHNDGVKGSNLQDAAIAR